MSENTRFAVLTIGVVLVVGIAAWFMFGGASEEVADVVTPAQLISERPEDLQPELPEFDAMRDEPSARTARSPSPSRSTQKSEPKRASGSGKITGTVRSSETDLPNRVEISLYELNWDRYESPRDDGLLLTTFTGADRKFEFTELPLGRYVLQARGGGVTGDSSATLTRELRTDDVAISVYKAGAVRGRIVDSSGVPIADAYAYVSKFLQGGAERTVSQARAAYSRSWTDDDGYYELESVQVRSSVVEYQIAATAPGYTTELSEYVPSVTNALDFVLPKGGRVSGTVVHAVTDENVVGVTVAIEGETPLSSQSFVSDDEGRFVFDGVRSGPLTLDIIHETLVAVENVGIVKVRAEEEASGVELKVAMGGTISGQVFDPDTDEGVPNAEVRAYGPEVVLGRELSATTDDAGHYVLTGLREAGYDVGLRNVKGYPRNRGGVAASRRHVSLGISEVVEGLNFEVRKGIQIGGRVIDSEGRGLVDVFVSARSRNADSDGLYRTETDGTFIMGGMNSSTTYKVNAQKAGFGSVVVEEVMIESESVLGIEIIMEVGTSISGIVVNSKGKPQSGVRVMAIDSVRPTSGSSDQTGSDGRFIITGLSKGSYGLVGTRTGFVMSMGGNNAYDTVVDIETGQPVENIRVTVPDDNYETIAGRVTTVRGDPISGARVQFEHWSRSTTSTDDEGSFEASGLNPQTYNITVSHAQYSSVEIENVMTETRDLLVQMRGRGAIEGRVFDASTRKPLDRFSIVYTPPTMRNRGSGNDQIRQFSDPEGYFKIERVEEAEMALGARAPGYARAWSQRLSVVAGETVRDVHIYMEAESRVEGVVVNTAGEPIAGAMIFKGGVPSYQRTSLVATYSNRDGEFRLDELSSGAITISADHDQYAQSSVQVILSPNEVSRPEIVMNEGGELVGRVTLNEEPLVGRNVSLNYPSEPEREYSQNQRTNEIGEYRFIALSGGEVLIRVAIQGRNRHIKAEIAQGAVTTVNFNLETSTASVYGHVYDQEGAPVSARIFGRVERNSVIDTFITETDTDGYYLLENLVAGTVNLALITNSGGVKREAETVSLELLDGASLQQDFHLGLENTTQ